MISSAVGRRTTSEQNGEVYLWLNCEGWVRFDDAAGAILGPEGEPVAVRVGSEWHTPGSHEGYRWRNPMITASTRHPHPSRG